MTGIRNDSLYVSNLSYGTSSDSLKDAFPACVSAMVVKDRATDKSKGYGFVRFNTSHEAQTVLEQVGGPGGTLNIDGRDVKINYAHDKGGDSGQGRGGFSGGRGRGGMGRGGYGHQMGYNQGGGYNNWSGQGQGYDYNTQQGGYGHQQGNYGPAQGGYGGQQGYGGGQQGNYNYGGQGYSQPNNGSRYGSEGQGQQNWQGGPQQNWQQGWQAQAASQVPYGDGDYQPQGGSYGNTQAGANWTGSYQAQ